MKIHSSISVVLFSVLQLATAARLSAAENLIPRGQFKSDDDLIGLQKFSVELKLFKGNPVPKDKAGGDLSCLEVTTKAGDDDRVAGALSVEGKVMIEPTKRYRFKCTFHMPEPSSVSISGYCFSGDSRGKPLEAGSRGAWAYFIERRGPTEGWQTVETTIGPENSDCKFKWLPEAEWINVYTRFGGEPGMVYLKNLTLEEF